MGNRIGEGGGGYIITQDFANFRDGFKDHQGGHRILPVCPPPPKFQVITEAQFGQSETSGAGASGKE